MIKILYRQRLNSDATSLIQFSTNWLTSAQQCKEIMRRNWIIFHRFLLNLDLVRNVLWYWLWQAPTSMQTQLIKSGYAPYGADGDLRCFTHVCQQLHTSCSPIPRSSIGLTQPGQAKSREEEETLYQSGESQTDRNPWRYSLFQHVYIDVAFVSGHKNTGDVRNVLSVR